MIERRCPYCLKAFSPSPYQLTQTVCGNPKCQQQRRSNYRRTKLAGDSNYREACRQSARQWRKQHPDYWKQYRQAHPASVERNRQQQNARDRKQHLQKLANNISASDLKPCPATVWVLGSALSELANNTSAPTQVWVLEALLPPPPPAGRLANNIPLALASGSAG